MVRGLVDRNIEISIALFCLESVKYESEDRALQFLHDHDRRHPPFPTPLKDQRKCLICKTKAITSSEAASNFYTPGQSQINQSKYYQTRKTSEYSYRDTEQSNIIEQQSPSQVLMRDDGSASQVSILN